MSIFGKTISLFLIEGDPNKRWVCELSNWNGKAYKIPRIEIKRCSDRKDLVACGIYFLFGKNDTDNKGIVYIGASDGYLYAIDQATGIIKDKLNLGAPIFSTVAVSGNKMIVCDFAGNVYCITTPFSLNISPENDL